MATAYSEELTHTGQDKVDRYGWVKTEDEGEFRRINKRLLKINNEVYQRDSTRTKVLEFASKWSWIACGCLVVAARDGAFWVVDGQHRKLAADRRSDIQDLPCLVFHVSSIGSEAQAFLDTNANRKPVTAIGKFKAQLATKNPHAMLVSAVVSSAGLHISNSGNDARGFKAVALAMSMAEQSPDDFITVMNLCGELSAEGNHPCHQRLIMGLHYIHKRIPGGLDGPRLRKRIKQIGGENLKTAADKAAAYYANGGARVFADGMMQAINHGLQHKFAMQD